MADGQIWIIFYMYNEMKTPEERKKYREDLQKEFDELLTPGVYSIEEMKEKEDRGVELLTKMVDHDILCRLFDLAEMKKNIILNK